MKVCGTVSQLEEANREILLGKRRIDCLSCGNGLDQTMASLH
jgi:hypothetical protein